MKRRIISGSLLLATLSFYIPCVAQAAVYEEVYSVIYNGHKYAVYDESYSWSEAKEICESLGGHLVTITSEEEQLFIEQLNAANNRLWIGGYLDNSSNWKWVTDEDWDFTNWADGEPNNSGNVVPNENCIAIWPHQWNDLNNDNIKEQNGFICEWDNIPAADNDNTIKVFLNGKRIFFDVNPVIKNDRTLVPVRAIAEALGANVGWDQDTRTVTIQRGMHTVVAQIGRKKIFTVLGPRELEVESQVIQNRTMIPVRALETIFSGDSGTPDIQWDGNTKTITINAEPYTDEAALKAFRDNGFAQFSYFRTYFLDEHLNDGSGVAYAIANTMSNIGRWTLDVFTFEFLHYQKNIYKDAVETVLTDIANTKSLKFADTIAEDMAEAIGKEAGFTNDEIEYYIKNDLPDVKLDGVKAKKMKTYAGVLKDAMGSFGKTIKWTKFSLEELACLFTDYTNNIAYLDMMKNAAAEDEDFLEAVNELELEYADWVLKLVFDASDEFRNYLADLVVESSLNLVGSSAASLFSLVTFAMEAGAKLAGAKNYSDNVEDAIALIGIANDLQTYTGEVKDKNYTAAEGLLPTADSETWSELVNAFTATRAALISGYKCMRAVTEDSGEKAFLDQQIKVLESLAISETLPDTPEGMFRFEK